MEESVKFMKWDVKGKAAKFSKDCFGYLLHLISGSPACIMGFENTGTPYSSKIYKDLERAHPDLKLSEISVNNGKITGFRKDCIQDRKLIVITGSPRDRGGLYAADIARKYERLRHRYNIRDLIFITANPFEIYGASQLLRQGFI